MDVLYLDEFVLTEAANASVGEAALSNVILGQNQPNPFNSQTTIQYTLTEASNVNFTVTDITGRVVRVIENQNLSAGNHNIVLNAADFAAGAYNYTLTSNGKSVTKKMFVTK
jgi:flagellar hook assembly protein FlgD